ncbi:MAG: preprotein translocase subunit YajC [Bacteroidota bacterium]|jgi:preprotein translocase subunit YajC
MLHLQTKIKVKMYQNLAMVLMMGAGDGKSSGVSTMILFGGMFVVMYFFMIRPQQKKAKDQKLFQEAIGKGDKIVTMSGIHGKITKVNDSTFDIEIANNVTITIEKSVISLDVTKAVYPKDKA